MITIVVYLAIYIAATFVVIWVARQADTFVRQHPTISNYQDIEAFKRLARLNMYLAVGQLLVFLVGFVLGIVLIFRHGLLGLLVVIGLNTLLVFLAQRCKRFEEAARSLPVANEELQSEYERICHSWVKKLFPDF